MMGVKLAQMQLFWCELRVIQLLIFIWNEASKIWE